MGEPRVGELIDEQTPVDLPDVLPVLPLEETVIFPFVIVPLSVEAERGTAAVDHALTQGRLVMLVARKGGDAPERSNLYDIGTVGRIMRMLKLPDGRVRVLAQGIVRAELLDLVQVDPFVKGRVRLHDAPPDPATGLESEALVRHVRESLERAMHLGKPISPEVMVLAANLDDAGRLADLVASNLELSTSDGQGLLEIAEPLPRLQRVSELLARETQLLEMQHRLSTQAQDEIERSQREYFLRQQLEAIREELGETDELSAEIELYRQRADEKQMPEEARGELEKQISRLERLHPESGEHAILRTYLDWLTGLPWATTTDDDLDLDRARTVLDDDHYGLEKVKERIVEVLAVKSLKPDARSPILCFVGPPGVGKTSLGRSIARALGREFVRFALGGVRDEAEIRGHRRTYVGAMPGRIVQGIQQAGTSNPVFMLDEIDKIGSDHRGDPSSALLEVLDPEQNATFRDHYLGVAYDLSKVLFITTANLLDPIQPAFLDRMEVIRLSGYTEEEKLTIAKRHLLPKQIDENGLTSEQLHLTDGGLRKVVRDYTREAGLRNLEREIAAICRKTAVRVAEGRAKRLRLDAKGIARLLGPERNVAEALLDRHRVGVATGLAWTAVGGDLLMIEAIVLPGRGRLHLTGQLGDVMKESGQAALTYVRSYFARHPDLLVHPPGTDTTAPNDDADAARDLFGRIDVHVHAPAGSIPKDGPSAGITIATAIVSALSARPVKRTLAMTGEITLRGEILAIGGLKEKVLAARGAGVHDVILPEANRKDLVELPKGLSRALRFHGLSHMDDVLDLALLDPEECGSAGDDG